MPKLRNLSSRIIIGLTGRSAEQVISKIKEADKLGIKEAGLFLEIVPLKERAKIYSALKKSKIQKIPLVHIRNDMEKWELDYLENEYHPKYLTIHENSFKYLTKWNGYHKKLFLEMNFDNEIPGFVDVNKIGGFCIDLSHFKSGEERWTSDFEYVIKNMTKKRPLCNHLNGYTWKKRKDIHRVKNVSEFEYLKTLPSFVFGEKIALEMFNPIKQQLEYKKHVVNMLN
ncbi:MAG: hypothetical protein WCW44_06280 [archaeon]|jgi:hypothetical protein